MRETKQPTGGEDGRRRVVIEGVAPEVDCGRFPIKRTEGDRVVVEADAFTDGHDAVSAVLLHRGPGAAEWCETPMEPLPNDRWRASFPVEALGLHEYTVEGWIDRFGSWRHDLEKKLDAAQDISVELLGGAALVDAAASRAAAASAEDAAALSAYAGRLRAAGAQEPRARAAMETRLLGLMDAHPDRARACRYGRVLRVWVDRERARCGAWYEMFPRSASPSPGEHGSLRDVEARLPYVAGMGFDILYLPPVHPIGRSYRKGKNNSVEAVQGDVGSPWAIGAEEGGHTALHPALGTLEEFRHLLGEAARHGLEVALDIAFQAAPDHPWVHEHPEWFRSRADGTIQYAENPPKKYQDIYPFDFESEDWRGLWEALRGVFEFWMDQGVRIFRVDNPHTKAFPFWAWLLPELKERDPGLIFLSEAFTRPKVMYRLAKLGFTQSYTYFAWRNEKWELEQYFTELTTPPVADFFRPNLWPNTPDILTAALQTGDRATFAARFILAATLGANYGIYGPTFELMEHEPLRPGSEEYLHSEKYQLRDWELDRPDGLQELIARVNVIRRENPALQADRSLRFHRVDNDQLIAYSKQARREDESGPGNLVLVVVNLDPAWTQSANLELPLAELGLDPGAPYRLHDLLADAAYSWSGAWNFVQLNPHLLPAHIFRVEQG